MSQTSQETRAAELRRQLLLINRERIEFGYEKAQADGMDEPVILVLDLRDERAARLTHLTGVPWTKIDSWCEHCADCDTVPIQVLAAPRWAAMCVVGPTTPNSYQGIAKPCPPGMFRVVAMAAGGNSFADFPAPPQSCFDFE